MKPPPFLLGATLLFWGWQAEFLAVGAAMAVVLESACFLKARWEFSDDDFRRLWTFCSVLLLGALVYAFTANEGPANFGGFFNDPNVSTQGAAGVSSARTAAALFRWLPMILFPFIAAHAFSLREAIPLTAISWILRRRQLRAKKAGRPLPVDRHFHPGFPYFGACLVGASVHPAENARFFWGVGALLAWALWSQRSRRFHFAVWASTLAGAVALGYFGQQGIWQLQRELQNLNLQWLIRLRYNRAGSDAAQSRTAFGRVGDLKLSSRIVIRLEPLEGSEPPEYLREASYRVFAIHTWYAGSSRDDFLSVPETPLDSGIWPLLPTKTNTAAVRIASYLNDRKEGSHAGLLPLPAGSGRLEKLRAFTLERNSAGAVLATGPGLVIFEALHGPGTMIDAAGDANEDLDVPQREKAALDTVIAELELKSQPSEQVRDTLAAFFEKKFTYNTWQDAPRGRGTNDTPLSRFLLETRAGHCEYFATATTLLLRRCGIPARYAVGYAVHEQSGRNYIVRLRDAHAWCLVWDAASRTWRDFDTTPGSWIATEAQRASSFRWLGDVWGRLRFEWSKIWWGQSQLRQYLLAVLLPILAVMLYQILFRRGRRRQRGKKGSENAAQTWPGLDSEFYELEQTLTKRGVSRAPNETIADWLERATAPAELADLQPPLLELLRLHYRYRFDPRGLDQSEREALRREARICLERLTTAGRQPARAR